MSVTQQTTDRRLIRGEVSRKAIVDAAIDCIAKRGLRASTVDTVAERANVSRALVLFHFKSKDQLHIEVLRHVGAQFSTGWDAVLADRSGSTSERLLRLLSYDVRFVHDYPQHVSVWHAFWGEAKGSTLYREMSSPRDRRYRSDVQSLLEDLVDEDGGYDVDLTAVVGGLEAMLFGFWLDAHLNPRPDRLADSIRSLEVYLSALFPRHFSAGGLNG